MNAQESLVLTVLLAEVSAVDRNKNKRQFQLSSMEESESFGLHVTSDVLDQVFDLLHSILFMACQVKFVLC